MAFWGNFKNSNSNSCRKYLKCHNFSKKLFIFERKCYLVLFLVALPTTTQALHVFYYWKQNPENTIAEMCQKHQHFIQIYSKPSTLRNLFQNLFLHSSIMLSIYHSTIFADKDIHFSFHHMLFVLFCCVSAILTATERISISPVDVAMSFAFALK